MIPASLQGQFRSGPEADPRGWAPASVGGRVGYDNSQRGWMVGGFVGIPVLPSGRVELLPSFDVTFLPGFDEYQTNFEAVYFTGDRQGGLMAGGGVGFRNSVFGSDPTADRRNALTFSVVIGARLGTLGRFRPQLETRWILQDEWPRDPRHVGLGVGVALWGP
ncbi:MAG: hypothetical protein AB7T31_01500 [Gemmatimonadales bacterium]